MTILPLAIFSWLYSNQFILLAMSLLSMRTDPQCIHYKCSIRFRLFQIADSLKVYDCTDTSIDSDYSFPSPT